MIRESTLARSLSILVVTLLLLVPLAFIISPPDIVPSTYTGAEAPHYSNENLTKRGTVFNDRSLSYSLPNDVRDMATGYLNGDSNTDVVVATKNSIVIFYGAGDGSLGGSFTVPMYLGDVRKVAVGDLNMDGKDDIAATYIDASSGLPYVGVFHQNESFSTSGARFIRTFTDPWQVVIGDFSNSGANGLAVICRGNPSSSEPAELMLLKWPFLTLYDQKDIELSDMTNPRLLTAGYVDTDDRLDLVVGNLNEPNVKVFIQPITFTPFWTQSAIAIAGAVADIRMTDYSGSGRDRDLAVVNSGYDRVEIWANGGNGISGSAVRTLPSSGVTSLATASVSGAQWPDLVAVSASNAICTFYPRQSGGIDASVRSQFPVNHAPIKVVGLDEGSSRKGVYVLTSGASGTAPALELHYYDGSGVSNADGNVLPSTGQPGEVCAGDVSVKVVATILEGRKSVRVTDLSGNAMELTFSNEPTALFIGNLDDDGINDLAVTNGNAVSIFRGGSGFMGKTAPDKTIALELSQPLSLTGGMISAIGKNVLIAGCSNGIQIIYDPLSSHSLERIGTGISGNNVEVSFGHLSPAGANGGIAALNPDNGRVNLFYVRSSPTVGNCYDDGPSASLYVVGQSPTSLAVGDFDGNGRDDAAVGSSTGTVKVFYNLGDGFYVDTSTSSSFTAAGGVGQLRSADLNDDGRDDLAVGLAARSWIGMYLSRGSSSLVYSFDILSGGRANGLFAGDINGDGRDDLLASSYPARAVSYWLQKGLAPTAAIWLSSSSIHEGEYVRFDASNCTDSASDLSTLSYSWNYGDGGSSGSRSGQHRYTSEGTYYGHLLVTDRSGLTDRKDFRIVVDAAPVASFDISNINPLKGETIFLQDTSRANASIASWLWDFGDGRTATTQDANTTYDLPGEKTITLTVIDRNGATASVSRTVNVQQATPKVEGIIANGGKTSFLMDEEIFFEVLAKKVNMPIIRYAWDLDYDASTGFNETPGITLNQTTRSYSSPNEHTICVRVYDANNYTEEYLTIMIMNSRPVADISAFSTKPGNFTFDAGRSWDTPTDAGSLEFRWNFGDGQGWTEWSMVRSALHNYTQDGAYTVVLEVRDAWKYIGSTTYRAVVDNAPPVIGLDDSVLSPTAYRGEDLVINVNVTDVSALSEVLLYYTTGNETKVLVMSRITGTDTYVATIPAADAKDFLTFYVEAVDASGYRQTSATVSVALTDRPDSTWIYLLGALLGVIAAIILLYYWKVTMVVEEVFIIYHDGNLMAHETRRLKPGMDDQILSSMLVAIQQFVQDSFKDEGSTGLNRMDFGEKKVLVERGERIYLAVVLQGKREGKVPQRMRDTISRTEREYSSVLDEWDGDLEKVRGIKDETAPLLRNTVLDLVPQALSKNVAKEEAEDLVVCPDCGTAVPVDRLECPKCGAALGASKGPSDLADDAGRDLA
ncbi:MAG: VCBS repeat-containing protein [Methanomassiliicoccus sp.]|nr:VCBS repeat-containing protein [Methanomassiliicoccus sp.]